MSKVASSTLRPRTARTKSLLHLFAALRADWSHGSFPSRRLCRLPLLLVFPLLLALASAAAHAQTTLNDVFIGNAQFVADTAFQAPPELQFHAETSTAFFNGQYMMYYRTFRYINSMGGISISSFPTGIALATSTDGNTFAAYNNGLPVIASGAGGLGTGLLGLYAPSVLADVVNGVPKLLITFEQDPSSGYQNIAKAESTDGINWSSFQIILTAQYAWEGVSGGNVGTPSLEKLSNGQYIVFYHGFRGTDGTGATARGFATGSSLTSLTRSPSNPVLRSTAGTWTDAGIGRGDLIQQGGYYYVVFEALRNSALCQANNVTGWGLARSTDLVNWSYSALNPIRIDRIAGPCGEDMPAFQVIGGQVYIVTTHSDINRTPSVRRYKISATPTTISTSQCVGMARTPSASGYWETTSNGGVYTYGNAGFYGSMGGQTLGGPIVGIAATPSGAGYWLVGSDGGIYGFGNAPFKGSMGGKHLNAPIVGMAATPSGQGYWLVASDGGIFTFGDAGFYGSMGGMPLNKPIVGMAATPSGAGYWMVASDGGIFTFGNASFYGSTGGQILNSPIVSMAVTPSGTGYWLVAQDGGLFTFGGAPFLGSTGSFHPYAHMNVVGMAVGPVVNGAATGYWMAAQDGGIIDFAAAVYYGHVRAAGYNQ